MRIHVIVIISFAIMCWHCKVSQPLSDIVRDKVSSGDGKCYAECEIPKQYPRKEFYPFFTGDTTQEKVDLQVKKVVIQNASTKWVKKRVDKNCISNDPDDCMVWCLEEIPAVETAVVAMKDTTQSKNFEMRKIEFIDPGGYAEWRPAVCEDELTEELIMKVQSSLKEKGFFKGRINGKLDSRSKNYLLNFQEVSRLPMGALDYETLEALNIDVPTSAQ